MWWLLRTQTILLAVVLLAGFSCSQSPGDADAVCTETLAKHRPTYPSNIRTLMDSADYENLISKDTTPPPVWQTVNVDNNPHPTARVDVSCKKTDDI